MRRKIFLYSKDSYQKLKNTLEKEGFKLDSFVKYIDKIEKGNNSYDDNNDLKKFEKIALDMSSLCQRIVFGRADSWQSEELMNTLEIDEDSSKIQYKDLVFVCNVNYKKIIKDNLRYCIEDLKIQDKSEIEERFLEIITYLDKDFKNLKKEYENYKFISFSNLDDSIEINPKIVIDVSSLCSLIKNQEEELYNIENIFYKIKNKDFISDVEDLLFVCNSKYNNILSEQFKYCFDKVTEYK